MRNIFILILTLFLSTTSLAQSTYDFVLNGRLTESNGKPVDGPIAMQVRFFHVATGGNPVLSVTTGLESVTLQEGVFHIKLTLDASEYHTVFPSVATAAYFEVTDLTNAATTPYERTQISMVPYAAKVPVDTGIFSYNASGKLTLASPPQSAKYLKGNADGTVSWDSPGSAGSSETYTNKTINADNNTITNIADANIKASASIADSKLATISTAGKVAGGAITSGTITGTTAVSTSGNIATTGKVGVGAAAGTSQMEVKGGGATSATSSLNVMDSAGSSKFFVRDDGNVGIGTTSPVSKLEVVQNAASGVMTIRNESASGWSSLAINDSANTLKGGFGWGNASAAVLANQMYFDVLGNNPFTIRTNGSEVARFTGAGNVGIGTTSPSAKLSVESTGNWGILVGQTSSASTGQRLAIGMDTVNTVGSIYVVNEGVGYLPLSLQRYGGNVGIGTTTPQNRLAVSPSHYSTGTASQSATAVTGSGTVWTSSMIGSHLVFANGTSAGTITAVNSSTSLTVNTNQTVASQAYTISYSGLNVSSTGKVGVGTIAPTSNSELTVTQTTGGGKAIDIPTTIASGTGIDFSSPTLISGTAINVGTMGIGSGIGVKINAMALSSGTALDIGGSSAGGTISTSGHAIYVHPIKNPNWMTSTESGNYLKLARDYGTSNGTFNITGDIAALSSNCTPTGGTCNDSSSILSLTQSYASASGTVLKVANSGTGYAATFMGGNVGIGTTSPAYRLTVNGEPGANGYTAFTNYSDRRLKTNIEPLESGTLDKIMSLKPSSFHYNDLSGYDTETRKRKVFGFIAQDLLKVFPKMVNETVINGKKYFDTNLSSLQIYLVKAIQELKAHADKILGEHAGRIAQLERENSEVRAQNLELRNYLCEKDPDAPFCGEL